MREFDVIVIGSGPAGSAAAVYLGNAGKSVLICTGDQEGGLLTTTDRVENYPALKTISGQQLASQFVEHAQEHGELCYEMVGQLIPQRDSVQVITTRNNKFLAKRVFIATGSAHKKLNIPGEKRLENRGVSYCAVCDGHFFKDEDLVVIGGGDSAAEEALYLSGVAKSVKIVLRGTSFRAKAINVNRLKSKKNIEILYEHTSREILGEKGVSAVVFDSPKGEVVIKCSGVFVAIGQYPNSKFLESLVDTQDGYILVNRHQQTSHSLIYAGGDVVSRPHPFKQAVIAASEGCIAGLSMATSLEEA
jgi:thioredoxin reductase (NADPH)